MAQDAAQLVVRLEAKLDQFERSLRQAGVVAEGQARKIEDDFSRINPHMTWATTLGTVLGRGIAAGMDAGLRLIGELIERFQKIQEAAKLAEVSLKDVFAVEKLLGPGGTSGFEKVAELLDRMKRGEDNALSKLFDANGVKNVKDATDAFDKVADIIQRLPRSATAYSIGKELGLDFDAVTKLREATGEFGALRSAASAAAPDLDKLAKLAKDVDDAWKQSLDAVKSYIAENGREMVRPIVEFVATSIEELSKLVAVLEKLGSAFGQNTANLKAFSESAKQDAAKLRDFGSGNTGGGSTEDGPLQITVSGKKSTRRGPASNAPSLAKGGGGGGSSLDSFEREERRANELAARLDQETASLDLNTEARTKNAETLRLRQMLEREGIPITDEYIARIDAISTKLARSTAANEQARLAQQRTLELQNFAGQELLGILDQMMERGAKASDVMRTLASSIARALAQAAILGTGPFAGLLGTGSSSPGNSVGGLVGLGVAAFKGATLGGGGGAFVDASGVGWNAEGTDNWRGGLSVVGEKGPELINLPRGAQVVPNHEIGRFVQPPTSVPRGMGARGVMVRAGDMNVTVSGNGVTAGEVSAIVSEASQRQRAALGAMVRDVISRGGLR